LMKIWWKSGFKYARTKDEEIMSEFRPDMLTDKEVEDSAEDVGKLNL
jgi:hypothetical protein